MQNNSSSVSPLVLGLLCLFGFGCDEAELTERELAQLDAADPEAADAPLLDDLDVVSQSVASATNYFVPVGSHDVLDCTTTAGWVKDGDTTAPTFVTIHRGAPYPNGQAVGTYPANLFRGDLPFADKNHGFSFPTPAAFKTGVNEKMYIHGINLDAAGNWDVSAYSPLLDPAGRTICCGACPSGPGNPKDPIDPPMVP